jgi:hypothetical protein
MGNMGVEQEKNTNEEERYGEDMGRVYREIGALSAMVAHGILGWSQGERGLQSVMESESLSDKTKESIKRMVEDLSGNSTDNVSNEIGDVNIGDQNELMESAKEKLKKEFKRLIRG